MNRMILTLCLPLALMPLAGDDPLRPGPWSDARLPVRAGLELWLDASRLNDAAKAMSKPALKAGDAVETWWDASGHQRHVKQAATAARPKFTQAGEDYFLRFDGVDDHFRLTGVNEQLQAFTVFLVAAPHDNPGDFHGFLAANAKNQRDYESGFTIDMGAGGTAQFDQVNVEGKGFGGMRDLHMGSGPFGKLHVIEAVADPERKLVQLTMDGKALATRPFSASALSFDEITVGARYYTNGPGAQQVRGHLQGDIAELLVYGRVLSEGENKAVREYLQKKHERLAKALPATLPSVAAGGFFLQPVENPPLVQMLVPGFSVRELPLDLTNINNVRYRSDGKLVALAYNGNIYLLSDTDGDGLEDKAELFWENKGQLRGPIGMALTPPGYPHGNGVFVPSKGKLSLIVDTDGDDKADKEIIVAQGWQEIPQAVDAVGVAVAKDGSIYFALGTANYANGYLIDDQGKSHYDLKSERGTVQKVAPDFKKRETVCTGVRFPVAMAFNAAGDLFCTDQEGATWLPNGNPFDELLHIQPGRHYGFPPRHPKHLPNVIDEPSVYDYGPQHQSTCGLVFNEPVNGGPVFGPAAWKGNAIVCGESRGKLFRTELVKSQYGYIARNQIIACLQMLTIDSCVSPKGDLVVACHSGPPDWGTGPTGKGKLFKISYSDKDHPQPVAVWAAGPQEVRIAFDRPLEPAHLQGIAKQTKITYGEYVRAGDRFETLRPPYQVVQNQLRTPRFELPVYGVQVTEDRRTLIVSTGPHTQAVHHAVTLPRLDKTSEARRGEVTQHPQIDLDYTLNGVEATFRPGPGVIASDWSGWLPHLPSPLSKSLTRGSASHESQWGTGTWTIRAQLDLMNMLHPAVQPGSRLDFEQDAEDVRLTFVADAFELIIDSPKLQIRRQKGWGFNSVSQNEIEVRTRKELIPVEIELGRGRGDHCAVSWQTADDERQRSLPLHRLYLPWVKPAGPSATPIARGDIPELKGGSWARGRRVFHSEEAACFKCHAIAGHGNEIGPDLANLVHRDYASVLRDVTEPSFAINPDYVSYAIELKSGRVLTGPIRTEANQLLIADEKGQVTKIARAEVERMQPSSKSVMPDNIHKTLGPEKMKDLLTFLLTEPPRMSVYAKGEPPKPRTRAEVQAILAGAPNPPEKTRPIHVVLVAGPKDHGVGEHDYPAWQKMWAELMSAELVAPALVAGSSTPGHKGPGYRGAASDTKVSTAWEWPNAEQLKTADVLVFFQKGSWSTQKAKDIDAYLARGGGLVYIHWSVDGSPDAPGFAQRIGLAGLPTIRYRHGPLDLGFETGKKHPIARNFEKVHFHDESYWKLIGDPAKVNVLAWSREDGEPQPQFWTFEPSKGRVFVSIPGHYSWTFDDPLFRVLLLRGIAWTAREPVDRFNELVTLGARVVE